MATLILTATAHCYAQNIFEKLEYSEWTTNNGINVILIKDDRSNSVNGSIWYKVGSLDENNTQTGISHAIEHMMFKDTKNIKASDYQKKVKTYGREL